MFINENGVLLERGGKIGGVSFGANASDESYAEHGFYLCSSPIVASIPVNPDVISYATSCLHEMLDAKWLVLKNGYPMYETSSWAFQVEEAEAYISDNTALTPFIDAARGGTSRADYCATVVSNNEAYKLLGGAIVALRRTFEDQIVAATNVGELNTIVESIKNA